MNWFIFANCGRYFTLYAWNRWSPRKGRKSRIKRLKSSQTLINSRW